MKIRSAVIVAGIVSALVGLLPQTAPAQEAPIERDPHLEDVPLRVRLQFLVLPHNGKPLTTAAHVQEVVARANEIYRAWNMQFDFDPATDFEGFPDAAVYNRNPQTVVTPDGVSIDTTAIALDREARRHPGKAVIWAVTTGDGGYSNTESDYVYFRFRRGIELQGDAFFLAHETGHFFGLGHTFDGSHAIANYVEELKKDPVKNAGGAQARSGEGKNPANPQRTLRAPAREQSAALDELTPDGSFRPRGGGLDAALSR